MVMFVTFTCVQAWQWGERSEVREGNSVPETDLSYVRIGHHAGDENTAALSALILAKPLFTIGRKVLSSRREKLVNHLEPLPRLTGIIVAPAGRRAVFVTASGRGVVLRTGGAIGDVVVSQITSDHVVLRNLNGNVIARPIYPHPVTGQAVVVASPAAFITVTSSDPAIGAGTRRIQAVAAPLGPVTLPADATETGRPSETASPSSLQHH